MKLMPNYGKGVVVLPCTLVEHIEKATKRDISILLELCAMPLSFLDLDAAATTLAANMKISVDEVHAAICFWKGTGVVCVEQGEGALAPPAPVVCTPIALPDKGLPHYNSEELSAILQRRGELSTLINDAQQAFGKVFNTGEIAVIAGLVDYLGLEEEYILLLLTHCRSMGKKSLRYVEKKAIELHDQGVHGVAELEEKLHRIEVMASAVGRIRSLFGITSRALTSKEKAMVERWICVMQFDDDMLVRAYEITVDTKGEASMAYTNGILERWYAEGYRSLQDVERAVAEYQRKKAGKGSSFDVDEFFEAALKRTYGE